MPYKNVREQAVAAIASLEKSIAFYDDLIKGCTDSDLVERYNRQIAEYERKMGIHQARIDNYDEEQRLEHKKPATCRAGKYKPYGGENKKK